MNFEAKKCLSPPPSPRLSVFTSTDISTCSASLFLSTFNTYPNFILVSSRSPPVLQRWQRIPIWTSFSKNTEGEDIDSDAGSFLDDDTEDFLPGNWTGNTTKSKTNILKKRPTPSSIRSLAPLHVEAAKTASKDVDRTTSTTKAGTITFNPLQPCFQHGMIYTVDNGTELDSDHHTGGTTRVTSIKDQLVIETSQLTLEAAISSETFNSIEVQLCSNTSESPLQSLSGKQMPTLEETAPEDTPSETNTSPVTISRL